MTRTKLLLLMLPLVFCGCTSQKSTNDGSNGNASQINTKMQYTIFNVLEYDSFAIKEIKSGLPEKSFNKNEMKNYSKLELVVYETFLNLNTVNYDPDEQETYEVTHVYDRNAYTFYLYKYSVL